MRSAGTGCSTRLGFVVAAVVMVGCAEVAERNAPTMAALPPPSLSLSADCNFLFDGVSRAVTRLNALNETADESAAYFRNLTQVTNRLVRDLNRSFRHSPIEGLAEEYKEAAYASNRAAVEAARLVAMAEVAKNDLKRTRADSLTVHTKRIGQQCSGVTSHECRTVVEVLLGIANRSLSSSALGRAVEALGSLYVMTNGLREKVAATKDLLAKVHRAALESEALSKNARAKVTAFKRVVTRFRGLAQRWGYVCKEGLPAFALVGR